jgi:hypothetical protein
MNERILELAKESGYVYHVGGTVPHFEFSNNQLKKFAELIVRECVEVANKTVIGSDFVGNAIRNHFGVEE